MEEKDENISGKWKGYCPKCHTEVIVIEYYSANHLQRRSLLDCKKCGYSRWSSWI